MPHDYCRVFTAMNELLFVKYDASGTVLALPCIAARFTIKEAKQRCKSFDYAACNGVAGIACFAMEPWMWRDESDSAPYDVPASVFSATSDMGAIYGRWAGGRQRKIACFGGQVPPRRKV